METGGATSGPIAGLAHLEPLRHIPDITQLDGDEAATLGQVLAAVTRALKLSTDAELSMSTCSANELPICTSTWPPTGPVAP